MRCHNCLRKITDANPSSTVNRWGKPCCDTCTTCEHGVALINPRCTGCEAMVARMMATN